MDGFQTALSPSHHGGGEKSKYRGEESGNQKVSKEGKKENKSKKYWEKRERGKRFRKVHMSLPIINFQLAWEESAFGRTGIKARATGIGGMTS